MSAEDTACLVKLTL